MEVEVKSEPDFWQRLRADQDRARSRADYLTRAKEKRLAAEPPRRARRTEPVALTAGALAIACAIALGVGLRIRANRVLHFSVGSENEDGRTGAWIAAPSGNALPLAFSDGSRITLAPASRARVAGTDAAGAHVVLEKGHAAASVVHRTASHWRVDVGPFEVAVVGTRFDVSWEPNEEVFQLQLEQGAVIVSGSFLHEPQRLVQGQTLRAFCKERREEIVESGSALTRSEAEAHPPAALAAGSIAPSPDAPSANVESEAAMPRARAAQPAQPTWQKLALAGHFRKALELAEQGDFDAECRRASGDDLQLLGDAARLSGSVARARQAYMAARGKLAGGGRTAYSLGLLAFDHEKDFASAARWFDLYLHEQSEGNLRREAEGRLMEAWQRAGDHDKARRVAVQYLRDYPSGTQAALARELANR